MLALFGVDDPYREDGLSIFDATQPISCHSHNDYLRVRPLYTAIEAGCTGVEADVWLDHGDLLVGHTRASLSNDHTLETMYLRPLLEILNQRNEGLEDSDINIASRNGIFKSDPAQSLILFIDFKFDGEALWPVLHAQLDPLRRRQYLTFFNGSEVTQGPVTVVVSGNAFFSDVVSNATHRDMFFDAPLNLMGSKTNHAGATINQLADEPLKYPTNATVYSPANSYYASVSFMESVGYPWHSRLSHTQTELIRDQIRGAHARGLKVRYWGVPTWPLGVRNYLWRVLVREGADVLNVDDVEAVMH